MRMLLLVFASWCGCARHVEPVAIVEPPPAVDTPVVVEPPPPPPPLLPPPARAFDAAAGDDARTLTNAWRVKHNEGVALLGKGDAAGALAAGKEALALAPAEVRREPLVLVATAASQARDYPVELEALAELALIETQGADVHWGVFYNGSVDAAEAGRPDLASRYALEAFARADDPAAVGPMALRAALAAGDLDGAMGVVGRLGATADPVAVGSLARALAIAGRCEDARGLDPSMCP